MSDNRPNILMIVTDPNHASYDANLLATINAKLNALIEAEIGEDKAPFSLPS